MNLRKISRPIMLLSATAALLLAPAKGEHAPMGSGEACAGGTCCVAPGSICIYGSHEIIDYYYLESGTTCS